MVTLVNVWKSLSLYQRMPFYAVAKGRQVGVCNSWDECKANVTGYSGARYKKFNTVAECQEFIAQNSSGASKILSSHEGSNLGSSPKIGSGTSAAVSVPSVGCIRTYSSCPEYSEDGYRNVWTDGACPGNGQNANTAGRGVFFGKDHPWNISERADGPPTNNRGEIQAAWRAIQVAKQHGETKLRINTDSDFLIKSIEKYMPKWKLNGWKTANGQKVKNKDDFLRLDAELDGTIDVKWKHVRGHKGIYGNEQADLLARQGAAK
ncbi:Ribonuclease H1 [Sergentomyia squamirostris]